MRVRVVKLHLRANQHREETAACGNTESETAKRARDVIQVERHDHEGDVEGQLDDECDGNEEQITRCVELGLLGQKGGEGEKRERRDGVRRRDRRQDVWMREHTLPRAARLLYI